MRTSLNTFLNRYPGEVYFLHADMWKWTEGNYKIINCGVQEPNMVNIAAGLASQGKRVIIYGVAGFVLYKAYEQIKLNVKGWAEHNGSIIFVNAGHNGCYSICGRGHLVDDDWKLANALDIPLFAPETGRTFIRAVKDGLKTNGVRFIRLGWDGVKW
jgi:transketolase